MSLSYYGVLGPGPSISPCVPWTEISQCIKEIQTQRGASTELDDVQAGTCTLTLDNDGGFFTPGKTVSNNLLPDNVASGGDTLGTTAGFHDVSGSTSVIYPPGYGGTNSVKCTVTPSNLLGSAIVTSDYCIQARPGQTFYLQGAVRNTTTSGYPTITVALMIHWIDASGNDVSWQSTANQALAVNSGWFYLSTSFTCPASAAMGRVELINQTSLSATAIAFTDSWYVAALSPFTAQTTEGVPIRTGVVQGQNLLPYQLANVDHWNDQTSGDVESTGLWSLTGAYTNSTTLGKTNFSTAFAYNSSLSGLQFGHSSTAGGNGALAWLVNASNSRITYLAPGTYTLRYVLQGVGFGSGAVANTVVNILNYPSAGANPTLVSTSTTSTTLTTLAQTVTATVTVPHSVSGLTGVELVVSLPLASSTVSTVVVSKFQLVEGTVVPAFTPGDCFLPLFSGWVDEWITTTAGADGRSNIEVDCTDQFRRLGNLTLGPAYEALVSNDPHTLNYWTCDDAASTSLTTVADSGLVNTPMSLVKAANNLSASFGLTAGASPIVAVAASKISTTTGGGLNPNHQIGTQTLSSTPASGTAFSWTSGSTGNCGATTNQGQYPQTTRINAVMPATGTAGQGSLDCWFTLPSLASGTVCLIGYAGQTTTIAGFLVTFTASSTAPTFTVSFNGSPNTLACPTVFDTKPHYFALTWTVSNAGSLRWTVYIDGVSAGSASVTYSAKPSGSNTIGANMAISATIFSQLWQGRISDISITDTATPSIAARYAIGTSSYTANEVGRIKMLMDVGAADAFTDCLDAPVGASQFPSYDSSTVLTDALKASAVECGGRFFLTRCGAAGYNNINHAPLRQVFKDSTGTSVDDGAQFAIDGDHVINFVAITTSDGTVYYASDRTSILARGAFPYTLTASYPAATLAQTIANALVQYHSQPITRVYGITFTCVNAAMAVQALGLDVGSRVTLAELPDSAPAASSNWIVQSVAVTGTVDGGATVPTVAVEMSPDLAA